MVMRVLAHSAVHHLQWHVFEHGLPGSLESFKVPPILLHCKRHCPRFYCAMVLYSRLLGKVGRRWPNSSSHPLAPGPWPRGPVLASCSGAASVWIPHLWVYMPQATGVVRAAVTFSSALRLPQERRGTRKESKARNQTASRRQDREIERERQRDQRETGRGTACWETMLTQRCGLPVVRQSG